MVTWYCLSMQRVEQENMELHVKLQDVQKRLQAEVRLLQPIYSVGINTLDM